jgi:hypothetical protein
MLLVFEGINMTKSHIDIFVCTKQYWKPYNMYVVITHAGYFLNMYFHHL